MAYEITSQGDTIDYGVVSITANKRDDIKTLPTSFKSGSTVFVIEDSSAWMLSVEEDNETKEWKEI